jgi:glycerol-3-phosphate acyltransferase PlsY
MFALWVILIDAGKGWLAAAVVPDLPLFGPDPSIDRLWLSVACATAVVVGHVYPVWYGFRGGKGAATLVGVLLGLKPVALLPVLAVWLLVVVISGFVGLATMVATAAFPAYVMAMGIDPSRALLSFGCVMLVFVCYTHRSNIERMRAGTENRAQRLWLLRKR